MYDIVIIGGGIVGLATAYNFLNKHPMLKLVILEKESSLGAHQTGHNSGVIHSGIYYKPGSLKARNCRLGIDLLLNFCSKNNVEFDICGKIIIASKRKEKQMLDTLYTRGVKNGIKGIKKISSTQIRDYEPHARGLCGLHVPETGIVNYLDVSNQLSNNIKRKAEIITESKVLDIIKDQNTLRIITETNDYKTRFVINCSGLYSDKIAKLVNPQLDTLIVPFRGEYFKIKKNKRYLVKNLIYPVPNPNYPFLGVHFTRTINGEIEAGPNAVLAFAREGYRNIDINLSEMWSYLSFPGFWRMAIKYYSVAASEYYRSFYKEAFVKELKKLVPEIKSNDVEPSGSGVRAQALSLKGELLDDFVIDRDENIINVINAPSPGATSSFAIGEKIVSIYES